MGLLEKINEINEMRNRWLEGSETIVRLKKFLSKETKNKISELSFGSAAVADDNDIKIGKLSETEQARLRDKAFEENLEYMSTVLKRKPPSNEIPSVTVVNNKGHFAVIIRTPDRLIHLDPYGAGNQMNSDLFGEWAKRNKLSYESNTSNIQQNSGWACSDISTLLGIVATKMLIDNPKVDIKKIEEEAEKIVALCKGKNDEETFLNLRKVLSVSAYVKENNKKGQIPIDDQSLRQQLGEKNFSALKELDKYTPTQNQQLMNSSPSPKPAHSPPPKPTNGSRANIVSKERLYANRSIKEKELESTAQEKNVHFVFAKKLKKELNEVARQYRVSVGLAIEVEFDKKAKKEVIVGYEIKIPPCPDQSKLQTAITNHLQNNRQDIPFDRVHFPPKPEIDFATLQAGLKKQYQVELSEIKDPDTNKVSYNLKVIAPGASEKLHDILYNAAKSFITRNSDIQLNQLVLTYPKTYPEETQYGRQREPEPSKPTIVFK